MVFAITPPVEPMLARLEDEIPSGDGWRYEPKWDGFRAIVFRDGDTWRIDSRNKLRLDRYFPELIAALAACLPARCVLDGEIVIPSNGGMDFELLQLRLHPAASRVQKLALETPAAFVAFDMLASGDEDLRTIPLAERRRILNQNVKPGDQCLVTPQTDDPATAQRWFEQFEGAGLDGIIAKHASIAYVSGKRVMVKVKHKRTADVIVGGYRMSADGKNLGSLLLGLYTEEQTLVFVGFTSSMSAAKKRETLQMLQEYRSEESFAPQYGPGGPSRWNQQDREWFALKPELVCEVAFDYLQGHRFRHGTRLLRWRPDKDPADCTYQQFERPKPFTLEEIRAIADAQDT